MEANQSFILSIRCITYNHSAFITNALNGFVMQQTSFPFFAVIIDDASTDGEQGIIRRYINESFDNSTDNGYKEWETEDANWTIARHKENGNCWFLAVYLKKNLYCNPKKLELIKEWMNTKYVALCEGDDYWTDPMKLQKQVAFLENHTEYSMCTHAALWERDGEMYKVGCQHDEECALSPDEVIRYGGLYLATASLVFRRELADDWPLWRKLADVGDYPLQILGTLRGGMRFFPEPMCVYRFQHPGAWTNKDKLAGINVNHLKTEIAWLKLLDEETHCRYSDAIYSHLIPFYSELFRKKQLGFDEYYKAFKKTSTLSNKRFVKDVLINNFYWLYKMIKR